MNSRRVSMVTLLAGRRRSTVLSSLGSERDQQIHDEVADQREDNGREQDGPPAPPKCQTEDHESEREEDRKRTHLVEYLFEFTTGPLRCRGPKSRSNARCEQYSIS